MRKRKSDPPARFPRKLSRELLDRAERGEGRFCEILTTLCYEALYDRISRQSEKPLWGVAGDLGQQLVFELLQLYNKISSKLNTQGVPPTDVLRVLLEEVFVPTAYIKLALNWRRGLSDEFQLDRCWYIPRFEKSQTTGPVQKVLECRLRAAGFRNGYDVGKVLNSDSAKKQVDRWRNGWPATISELHKMVGRFSENISWVGTPDEWKTRFTLAVAMENLCKEMDRRIGRATSLKLIEILERVHGDSVSVDSQNLLAQSYTFFAARLLKRRFQMEGKWETEVHARVQAGAEGTYPTNPSEKEMEKFRRDIEWKTNAGNWFLRLIEQEIAAHHGVLASNANLSEQILDLGIAELNRLLDEKRGRQKDLLPTLI